MAAAIPMWVVPRAYRFSLWIAGDKGAGGAAGGGATATATAAAARAAQRQGHGKGELEREAVLHYRKLLVSGSPAEVSFALAVVSEVSVYIEHQALLRECGVFKAAAELVFGAWADRGPDRVRTRGRTRPGASPSTPLPLPDVRRALQVVADLSHNGNLSGADVAGAGAGARAGAGTGEGLGKRLAEALVGMAVAWPRRFKMDAVRALAGMAGSSDVHVTLMEAGVAGMAVETMRQTTEALAARRRTLGEGEAWRAVRREGGDVEALAQNVSGLMFALTAPDGDAGVAMLWAAGAAPVLLDAMEEALRTEVREERRRRGAYAESMHLRQSLGALNRMLRTKAADVARNALLVRRATGLIARAARESHDPHVRCFAAGALSRLADTGQCPRALVRSGGVAAAVGLLGSFHVNTTRDPNGGTVGGPRGMSLGVCRCASRTVASLAGQPALRAALRHAEAVDALEAILSAEPDPQYAQLEGDIRERGRFAVSCLVKEG